MEQTQWIDKHEAARCLDISTRSVLALAQNGDIQSKRERDSRNNQTRVMLHAGDVERVRHERENPGEEPVPRVKLQASHASHGLVNGEAQAALVRALSSIAERATAPVSPAAESPQSHNGVRLAERLYLTVPEAAEYVGLGIGYLRRQIAEGKLQLVKGAGPRRADVVRRADLEKL